MTARPFVVMLRPLGRLGDFLSGVPAYRAVARAFPRHRIVLAAPHALAPLAELVGAIDDLHDTPPLVALDPPLHAADVAIDLHGRGPASIGSCSPRNRGGWSHSPMMRFRRARTARDGEPTNTK